MTGGKPFIVNTSENGRGPVHYRSWIDRSRHLWRTINVWCHPLRRGLGIPPTTFTANPKVDAYMWINRPGYSGGSCNGGPLPIGSWWPERALMFATYRDHLAERRRAARATASSSASRSSSSAVGRSGHSAATAPPRPPSFPAGANGGSSTARGSWISDVP